LLIGAVVVLLCPLLFIQDRSPLLAEGGPPETAGHAAPKAKVNALIMTYPFDEALQKSYRFEYAAAAGQNGLPV
jgi:hypothetical protein